MVDSYKKQLEIYVEGLDISIRNAGTSGRTCNGLVVSGNWELETAVTKKSQVSTKIRKKSRNKSERHIFLIAFTCFNYYVGKSLAECYNYTFLNESGFTWRCGNTLSLGWFRFSGEAGSQMADSCVNSRWYWYFGWLKGTHPAVADGVVQRQVCFSRGYSTCWCTSTTYISVRNCGAFYVYKLNSPNVSYLRFCGNRFVPSTPGTRGFIHLTCALLCYIIKNSQPEILKVVFLQLSVKWQ